ncbi:MAG TPA: hypothetical protein VFN35_04355 [Ktedonobacteraceae bacterium]|nr:hypothetical protein [Ktedonobacteraceae bacterium]
MAERSSNRVHAEAAVLDIGENIGALIIHCRPELKGKQIDISPQDAPWQRVHTDVLERRANNQPLFAALFFSLLAGTYFIWGNGSEPVGEVSITGGQVAEIDWRHLLPTVLLTPIDAFPATLCAPSQLRDLLPARYLNGKTVSTAPMGSAPLRYDAQGQVAWDQMWTDFCDLALAGGPPHRGTLLEPANPAEIAADLPGYERAVAEIERGLRLVSNLPILRSQHAGWVAIQCANEEMALWLLRAILVENVCARREGSTLFLPAGPSFQLEKEIKNVITVLAKTYHYWSEHAGR